MSKKIAREKLQTLLYLLLRDELNFGALEKVMTVVDDVGDGNPPCFSEGSQVLYVETIVDRILGPK